MILPMQEKDSIQLLTSLLQSKDNELRHLHSRLEAFQNESSLLLCEQHQSNALILAKLDETLCEIQNIRRENEDLARQIEKTEQENIALRAALRTLQ